MLKRIMRQTDDHAEDRDRLFEEALRYGMFGGAAPKKLDDLVPALRIKEFQDEPIECHCSDARHEAFIILEGKAAATRKLGPVEHIVDLVGFGAMFKMGGLVGHEDRFSGARALGPTKVIAIDTELMNRALAANGDLGYICMKNLGRLMMMSMERQLDRHLAAL